MNRSFECKRDNLIIKGCEYRNSEEKLPAVILSHGYLANQRMCKSYAKLIADLGYAAFTFDFNGGGLFSKSSGKSLDMTINTEVEDLKSVIAYVRSLDNIDSSDIALLGCSQGGMVSAITAKERTLDITRLILLYPAFCIPYDARAGKMIFAKFDPKDIPDVVQKFPMKLSGNYAKSVRNWMLSDIAGDFDRPVLYLHGTADKIVNVKYARAAKILYSNCEYHEIEGGGHMFRGKYDKIAQEHITAFLGRKG